MSRDKLKWVRIQGFRSIEDVTIELEGLQVLIGENGAGKSTIIEAFELLSKTVTQPRFVWDLASRHGSIRELKRVGSQMLRLSTMAELAGPNGPLPVEYSIALAPGSNGGVAVIVEESLSVKGSRLFSRTPEGVELFNLGSGPTLAPEARRVSVSGDSTALSTIWGLEGPDGVVRVRRLLESIRVHLPFDSRPRWSQPNDREQLGIRSITQLAPADRLERGGVNLASVFQRLIGNPRVWSEVLRDIRAGLGADISSVSVPIKQSGGFGELTIGIDGVGDLPASQLSDGQLSYLALVALAHLGEDDSVLLFDEPELHLNPALLVRATWLFERIAERHPVILATHADGVLDALRDESESVRVVELDSARRTRVRKLQPERLKKWSEHYTNLSAIRREGLLSEVTEASP